MAGALAGWLVVRLLEHHSRSPRRLWAFVCSTTLAVSMIGPSWFADGASAVALMSLHVVTAVVVVAGFARIPEASQRRRPPGPRRCSGAAIRHDEADARGRTRARLRTVGLMAAHVDSRGTGARSAVPDRPPRRSRERLRPSTARAAAILAAFAAFVVLYLVVLAATVARPHSAESDHRRPAPRRRRRCCCAWCPRPPARCSAYVIAALGLLLPPRVAVPTFVIAAAALGAGLVVADEDSATVAACVHSQSCSPRSGP